MTKKCKVCGNELFIREGKWYHKWDAKKVDRGELDHMPVEGDDE